MDDRNQDIRTQEIKEGAGLDESRLNQEFIDALRKWSSPILFVLAGLMGLWALNQHLDRRENERINTAFLEFSQIAESSNPSPASLRALASEYEGVGSIATLARMTEADLYMTAVTTGLMPGAELDPITGEVQNAEDIVTDDSRATLLSDAESIYRRVLSDVGDSKDKGTLAMGAMFGLASIAEARGDADAARASYAEIEAKAEQIGFPEYAGVARDRAANVDEILAAGPLPTQSDLPQPEAPEAPVDPASDADPAGPNPEDGTEDATPDMFLDPNMPLDLTPEEDEGDSDDAESGDGGG